jgi:hypothetical protein
VRVRLVLAIADRDVLWPAPSAIVLRASVVVGAVSGQNKGGDIDDSNGLVKPSAAIVRFAACLLPVTRPVTSDRRLDSEPATGHTHRVRSDTKQKSRKISVRYTWRDVV